MKCFQSCIWCKQHCIKYRIFTFFVLFFVVVVMVWLACVGLHLSVLVRVIFPSLFLSLTMNDSLQFPPFFSAYVPYVVIFIHLLAAHIILFAVAERRWLYFVYCFGQILKNLSKGLVDAKNEWLDVSGSLDHVSEFGNLLKLCFGVVFYLCNLRNNVTSGNAPHTLCTVNCIQIAAECDMVTIDSLYKLTNALSSSRTLYSELFRFSTYVR